ncbi:MAG: hypothetical protein M1823_000154 [Watsoniomyces obsoletus]|nr:MAG: hypothetical protein M1823_000154 [Watsoniomyces obsoletus]
MNTIPGRNELSSRKRRRSIADSQSVVRGDDDDKENATTDVAGLAGLKQPSMPSGLPKKSRSKSMGPGGLDALTNATFNQRKATMTQPVRSILKPTIPLSPPQERRSTLAPPGVGLSGRASIGPGGLVGANITQNGTGFLIDLSTPGKQPQSQVAITGSENLQNPFGSAFDALNVAGTGAQAPAGADVAPDMSTEEREQREKTKKEILERREARRKSLANRRVSFAPEATLHTWNVIEFVQDSTASSGSTNSNRRASAATNNTHIPSSSPHQQSPARQNEEIEVPSTPIQQLSSPVNQTPLARTFKRIEDGRKSRRGSDAASSGGDDSTGHSSFSSPLTASSAADSDDSDSDAAFIDDASNGGGVGDGSAEGESTSMSLDSADMTMDSPGSVVISNASTSSSTSQLNEALRLAAAQAGTKGIEYDENGDLSMEIASDQVTAAFQSWAGRRAGADVLQDLTAFHDQENLGAIRPQKKIVGSVAPAPPRYPTQNAKESRRDVTAHTSVDMTMDMTRPVGGILPSQPPSGHVPGAAHTSMDMTMEMTRPVGRILSPQQPTGHVVGAVVDPALQSIEGNRRGSVGGRRSSGEGSSLEDATMDFTVLVGGIKGAADAQEDPEPDGYFSAMHDTVPGVQSLEDEASEEVALEEVVNSEAGPAYPVIGNAEPSMEELLVEKMSLQEFLDLTAIHFMDLTTTKRRHTEKLGGKENRSGSRNDQAANTLEGRLRDACCVLPMLELHQHSCRELKKYISEGRTLIRQIEANTYAENPSLFREYMMASPEAQTMMDNQFRNMKTHARLSSKAQWYDWRRKLLDGLKAGLLKMAKEMSHDDQALHRYEEILSSSLPELLNEFEMLSAEHARVRERTEEIASADQIQLTAARNDLLELDTGMEQKKAKLETLQLQIRNQQEKIEMVTEKKMTVTEDIRQAEKIRGECQGWSESEVREWKRLVDDIEREHGWTIATIEGNTIQMMYRQQLLLVLDMRKSPDSPFVAPEVSLCPSIEEALAEHHLRESSTSIKKLFIHTLNDHFRLPTSKALGPNHILKLVSTVWSQAIEMSEEVEALNRHHVLQFLFAPEASAASIKTSFLLPALQTKIVITFSVVINIPDRHDRAVIVVRPRARVVYGARLDEEKMGTYMARRLHGLASGAASKTNAGSGRWLEAVKALGAALLADGTKGKSGSS